MKRAQGHDRQVRRAVPRAVDGGDHRSYYNVINNYFKPGPGTPDDDVIHGFRGDDRLAGRSGHDTIYGDAGADILWGETAAGKKAPLDAKPETRLVLNADDTTLMAAADRLPQARGARSDRAAASALRGSKRRSPCARCASSGSI